MSAPAGPARRSRGMSLIETLVALTVGLVLSAAVFAVLKVAEGRKRTLTSVNDLQQAGNLAMYQIDKWVRSAGSSLAPVADLAYGCAIQAKRSDLGQLLPATAALPAPFNTVVSSFGATFRLAPVVILPGATTPGVSGKPSDALLVFGAAGGSSGVPINLNDLPPTGGASSSLLSLTSTQGLTAADMLLLVEGNSALAGPAPCMVQQVGSSVAAGSSLTLAGTFYAATVGSVGLDSFSDAASVLSLGNANGNPPPWWLIGVGDRNVLYAYDLLRLAAEPLQQRAEGVFELHALYGLDLDGDGKVLSGEWVSPSATGYTPAALWAGTAAAATTLKSIKAVRIGLLMRTSLPERSGSEQAAPANTSLTLFADTSVPFTRTFSGDELNFRYRAMELTVPVRNNLLMF